jgi:hypothetical protein
MGTTLTGTTPATTYDSLIKVTDNGPLSGTLKKLTDGLGNDSSLSLSTTAASLSGNLTSTGSASFTGSVASAINPSEQAILQGGYLQFYNAAATNKFIKLTDDASTIDGIGFSKSGSASTIWFPSGSVGIGTSSPTQKLSVSSTGVTRVLVENTDNQATGAGIQMLVSNAGTAVSNGTIRMDNADNMSFFNVGGERVTITSAGNVGIGTSAPSGKLHVAGGDIFLGASYALKYNSTSYITPENNVSGAEVSTGGVFVVKTGVSPAERLRVDASGNVGIGTGSPAYRFNVVTDAIAGAQNLAAIDRTAQNFVTFTNPQFSTDASMGLMLRVFPQSDARQGAGILASGGAANGETDLNLFVSSGTVSSTSYSALTLKGGSGWVGIGTTSPASKMHVQNGALQVSGNSIDTIVSYSTVGIVGTATAHDLQIIRNSAEICRVTANGLTFNGDTAAANALDDYEEGTFTATITPSTSGTITSGGTFTTWTYTKIGRQVTISGVFVISSVASPVGANVIIGGLPFTIFNNNGAYGAFSAAYFTSATSADSAVAGRHSVNTTQLTLGVDASTIAASDEIYVKATYFV